MKKICLTFIVFCLLLSLTSCTQYTVITRYEQERFIPDDWNGIRVSDIDYERMLYFYSYFFNREEPCYELYLPTVGEFVTEDGEQLVSKVDDIYFHVNGKTVGISFTLRLYRPDGTRFLEEELSCGRYSEDDPLDGIGKITYAMEKYWNALKALPSEILAD